MIGIDAIPAAQPPDEHNGKLVQNVRPATWMNPAPAGRYNLVVVGAGTAGLVTAAGAAALGAKVAIVERSLMGGDCLNVGCVPSKALIRCARAAHDARMAGAFGVCVSGEINVDFPAVMERMRRLRARISPHDSARRFADMGVDVFFGEGAFAGEDTLEVGGATLRFARACIATGTRPTVPPIDGLEDAGYLTNETIFTLTRLPQRLAILGGGPIGCELAQAFARFGTTIYLIEKGERILARDDEDAAAIVRSALQRDGVTLRLRSELTSVARNGETMRLTLKAAKDTMHLDVEALLVAVGRTPNVEYLGLEPAGVRFDSRTGVEIDDFFRTSNRRIYAAGDICSDVRFTHAADFMARAVVQNALFFGRKRRSAMTVPWCTYTDPEVAHVGLNPHDAQKQGVSIETYEVRLRDVDRAILEGDDEGFLRIHTKRGRDEIVGATLVARYAGDMISEVTLAMRSGAGLKSIASTIHPYPTTAEAIRKAGDIYNRTRLTPPVKSFFGRLMSWRR